MLGRYFFGASFRILSLLRDCQPLTFARCALTRMVVLHRTLLQYPDLQSTLPHATEVGARDTLPHAERHYLQNGKLENRDCTCRPKTELTHTIGVIPNSVILG